VPSPERLSEHLLARAILKTANDVGFRLVDPARKVSIRNILLTRDTESIGRAVGNQPQADEVEAELLPQQKPD